MKLRIEATEEIENLFIKFSILKKGEKIGKVKTIDDALYLLKSKIDEDLIGEMWPEDIGTDQDADKDYVSYMSRFKKFTKDELEFRDLNSKMDGDNVEITFKHEKEDIVWRFEQYSDHLNTEFLTTLFEYSKRVGANQLMDLVSEDAFQFAYVPNEIADYFHANGLYD